jgi:hypothetical protein
MPPVSLKLIIALLQGKEKTERASLEETQGLQSLRYHAVSRYMALYHR